MTDDNSKTNESHAEPVEASVIIIKLRVNEKSRNAFPSAALPASGSTGMISAFQGTPLMLTTKIENPYKNFVFLCII